LHGALRYPKAFVPLAKRSVAFAERHLADTWLAMTTSLIVRAVDRALR